MLRDRLRKALLGRAKNGSAVSDLGCSIEEFMQVFQEKFHNRAGTREQMTWENRGEWHIDHIIPLSYFDLSDKEQIKIACNYMNLQPLWAEENLKKSDSVPDNAEDLILKIKEEIKHKSTK